MVFGIPEGVKKRVWAGKHVPLCMFLSGYSELDCRGISALVPTIGEGGNAILTFSQTDQGCKLSKHPLMSQSIPTGYIPPGNPRGLAQKNCLGGRDLTFESCPGAGNSTRAGILWKFKVKHFVLVLVLLVINIGIAKNWGTLHC